MCKVRLVLTSATAYAQCRQEIDGSWAPDSSWQCQQPGSSPTGTLNSNTGSAGDTSSGGSTTAVPVSQDNTSSDTDPGSTTSSDGSNQSTDNTSPDTDSGSTTSSNGSNQSTDNTSPDTDSGNTTSSDGSNQSTGGGGGSQAATIGDCTSASPPGGWDGVASTSVSAGSSPL